MRSMSKYLRYPSSTLLQLPYISPKSSPATKSPTAEGFALRLVGGGRDTRDVNIVFQAPRKLLDKWDIIDQERRQVPLMSRFCICFVLTDCQSYHSKTADIRRCCQKIFVKTGGERDKCPVRISVEVDLIQHGMQQFHSAPSLGSFNPTHIIQHLTAARPTWPPSAQPLHSTTVGLSTLSIPSVCLKASSTRLPLGPLTKMPLIFYSLRLEIKREFHNAESTSTPRKFAISSRP